MYIWCKLLETKYMCKTWKSYTYRYEGFVFYAFHPHSSASRSQDLSTAKAYAKKDNVEKCKCTVQESFSRSNNKD